MNAQTTDLAVRPAARARPMAGHTFAAWCIIDDGENRAHKKHAHKQVIASPYDAYPGQIDVSEATSLQEAIDLAAPRCSHKDHLVIVSTHGESGRQRAHFYAIKRDSTPRYAGILRTERYHVHYAQHLFDMSVQDFAPRLPWRLTRNADLVGEDCREVKA